MAGVEGCGRACNKSKKNNKLTIEEMSGGTFTITNGGILSL
jgi:pyruvate/2-oxoglutarate dehydrogenase complex dihydrolipoamide acyltransferase (E2) component